jgi:hypothetical protein
MRAARNVAIILALAAVVAFVPGGGNASATVFAALWMSFLVAITFSIYVFSRQNSLTLASLADSARILLYGGFGLIVLLIAGQDEMFSHGPGLKLLWFMLIGVAVAAIWRVWMEATSYE